jgi:murein tripeptide amidase MpaA
MKKFVAVLFLFAVCFTVQARAQYSQPETVVARIRVESEAETRAVVRLGLDLMEYREGDELVFWTTEAQINQLREAGWRVRVDAEQTQEVRRMLAADTFNGGYRTVEETRAFLEQMQQRYPNLAQTFTYGQSWLKTQNAAQGYDLFGIRLTNRTNNIGNKPTLFIEAGIHARELVPVEIAARFVEYLLTNYGTDADATWLLDEHQIVVVPIVNPDGRKLAEQNMSKRKNMKTLAGCSQVSTGVDLNRNFQYLWGTVNLPSEPPCSETYPGATAASEPETAAIQNLVNSLFPDQRGPARTDPAPLDATGVFMDMHSTGNLVLYPWGQDNTPPPNLQLRTISQKLAAYNGYNPIQSIQLYPTSGTAREYAYGELGVVGLAMEIGAGSGACGGFMPAYSCLDGGAGGNFWNLNRPVLLYLAKIARAPYMTGEGATAETLTVARSIGAANSFALRAQISDAANGNQNVAAAEVYVDVPPWRGGTPVAMTAEDGAFNSPIEFAVATVNVSPGRHIFYVRGRDAANNWGAVKAAFSPRASVNADFDGDGQTDVSVFRQSNGTWYASLSANNGFFAAQFGANGDRPTPQDFDGDGRADLSVFRGGAWYRINSSNNAFSAVNFGLADDIPAAADYDGDGRADIAVFRPSNGTWYGLRSSTGAFFATPFGSNGDAPVVGDYDGDGRADFAVFRPSNGTWYLLQTTAGFAGIGFGASGDRPVQGDYDGDGRTDVAVFRNGTWYLLRSTQGFTAVNFGVSTDVPAPGDYDGDGKTDTAVFRAGVWYILQSANNQLRAVNFGTSGDLPAPAAYLPN